jgi:L-lactate dehydrogenase (cytochrome)
MSLIWSSNETANFVLMGIMSVKDTKRAIDVGCTVIIISSHGGSQLDGSGRSFDQLAGIVDAVGDRIDVLMDGGVRRGTYVLKALSLGAKAVGLGRFCLFPLATAGHAGVERALALMHYETEWEMRLIGCTSINQLSRNNLRFRSSA